MNKIMYKKILALALAFALVFSMSACSSSKVETSEKQYDYDLSEYVTVGEYKGIEVERVDPEEVTDEDVQSEITSELESKISWDEVDRPAENGDRVNIDYEGKVDGKPFDGGNAEGYDLPLGDGAFIEGFEEGLVGASKGDTKELNLTFPDPYVNNEELSGKAVVFTVKVNSVSEENVPELNDEYVKSLKEDYKTVEEYKKAVREDLEEQAEESAKQAMMSTAWQKVMDNSEVIKYPEEEVAKKQKEMKDYYEQYAESYGMSWDDFISMTGMTEEQFTEEAKTYAEESVKEEMIMYTIARNENIAVTEGAYEEEAQKYVESLGYESIEALEEAYDKDTIITSILWNEVFEFLLDNAKIVEPGTGADTEGAAAEEDATAEEPAATEEAADDAAAAEGEEAAQGE